jgi:DNA-binding response OmpR family regulator
MNASEEPSKPERAVCVVVLDDNAAVLRLLTLGLNVAGFDVRLAATEIELQRVLAHAEPDALLLDLQYSETAALKLLSRMRARKSLDGIPIIFLSTSDADELRQQAIRAGADCFEPHPVSLAQLRATLARLVQRGHPKQLVSGRQSPVCRGR